MRFSLFGLRAAHDGRQNTPVVRTHAKKRPSKDASLAYIARSISDSRGSVLIMLSKYSQRGLRVHRFLSADFGFRKAACWIARVPLGITPSTGIAAEAGAARSAR